MNWLFVDMNSYFASVEQHFRPELRGKAVGVVPVESDHTSIIAASREAKRHGIKTGTPVLEARRLCPDIQLVRARPEVYVQTHHSLLASVDRCAPIHKVYSVDEWAIRLTGRDQQVENALALGRQIKAQMRKDFGTYITCSIGIAPTRLLAKIASDLQKPDGLTTLDVPDLPGKLDGMELTDLCGISHGILGRLHAAGVKNIAQLWELTRQKSVQIWGSAVGSDWWAGFHGLDEPEIPTRRRSMIHASVLDPRFRNDKGAYGILVRLLCRLGVRLRADGYFAQGLQVQVSYTRGGGWTEQAGLPCIQDTPTLLACLAKLWKRHLPSPAPPFKVGVQVCGLVPVSQVSLKLFDELEKPRRASDAIDKINRRWGISAIYYASMHDYRHKMEDKIAFGRIPKGMQKLEEGSAGKIEEAVKMEAGVEYLSA